MKPRNSNGGKEKSKPVVAWLPADIDACALWRMYIPHVNMAGSKFLHYVGAIPLKQLEGCQVAVVQRLHTDGNVTAMEIMKDRGIKIIYDLDDNLWSIQSYNPMYKLFKEVRDQFTRCAMLADLITVSTRGLQSALRSSLPGLKVPVQICPNAIDPRIFRPLPVCKDDGYVVVGWGGSGTHRDDVRYVWEVLERLLDKYSNLKLEFAGGNLPKWLHKHPRVNLRQWVPVSEFGMRFSSWGWDISVAPLEDNRFNRSKSNIKILEAASVGIPCLASDVQPYREFAELGNQDVQWALCSDLSQWESKLSRLIEDKEFRHGLAKAQQEVMTAYFHIDRRLSNWEYATEFVCR